MKITSKTLMVSFETEVKLGTNDAIELTLQHQAFITDNGIDVKIGIDISDVRFLGVEIEPGFQGFREFKTNLLKLGIDLDKLIDEEEKNIRDLGIEDKLKFMFKDKI